MVSHGIDLESEELCLIDSGVRTLQDVPLRSHLQVLNLHCNYIRRIENLRHLKFLRHLDLSSNQIKHIEGLDGLVSLRTLNLACNLIEVVQGLENLRSLVKLNLAYNAVHNLSGIKLMSGRQYKLTDIQLQGNKIQSTQHVMQCLQGCGNLRQLTLSQDGRSNPVCQAPGYRSSVLSFVPQLQVLDGVDRQGNPAVTTDILADIPGLEQYMEYLLSSSSSTDVDPVKVATPNIDQALERFRSRGATTPEISTNGTTDQEGTPPVLEKERPHITHKSPRLSTDHDDRLKAIEEQLSKLLNKGAKSPRRLSMDRELRLEKLEHQLAHVLYGHERSTPASQEEEQPVKRERSPKRNEIVPKRDVDQTDGSETESQISASKQRRVKKSRIPGLQKQAQAKGKLGMRQQESKTSSSSPSEDISAAKQRKQTPGSAPRVLSHGEGPTAISTDEQRRNDIQSTYVQLMQELEGERERRWKAEQATKKLVDHIKELQSKGKEDKDLQDVAIQATTRLKQALTNEREAKLRLQDEVDSLKEQIKEVADKLKSVRETEEKQRRALRALEDTAAKFETQRIQEQAHQAKKTQEAQMRAAASNREVELLQNSVKTLKGQLQQMQELLAAREQEHRKALSGKFDLHSKEMQEIIAKEMSNLEQRHSEDIKIQKEKVETLLKQYSELEDEFRMALQIEANRFEQLQEAFEKMTEESAQNKQTLLVAQRKDEKSTKMITELTALVKEQKGRLSELTKSKQEQFTELKERNATLEAHVEEARKRMVQFELLKQEKTKMQSQLQAQESVIEGLKAERKLWGQELAHQGASLAQDRGRMEAKIDALNAEVTSLKRQLENELDTVKIKTKVIDDQTETIKKLKDGLLERDEDVKKTREENLKIQKSLEEQLTSETAANQDLQEKIDRLTERKDGLKQELADIQAELEDSKKAHHILNKKWKEKSGLIGQLEEQVKMMKSGWEEKEKKLTDERDKAIQAGSVAIEKMRSIDDSFRKQLDQKQQAHDEELEKIERQKQQETELANQKVFAVEEEMRMLLKETQASKKAMEDKIKKMNKAFSELQQDFL